MVNNEAGAFLNITPDVLKKLDSFDEKLEKIEEHAHTAADALKNGFGSVVVDTSKLESAIASLASKISALNTAGRVFDNIGDSVQQSSVRVEGMSSSISSMAQTLNQLKFSNFSIETFSPENVAKMRETVSQIKSQLKNNTSLSDSDKSALSKEKAMYEEKLKEYQSFINIKNKIAANANAEELRQQQATYRKMTNVMESYMKKVEEQKQRYESAMKSMADYAAQSPAQRVSLINNTLNFSANAKTLQEDVAAIKLLKETRLQLDKTDKNYQATLNQINSAIAKHNQALTEAGVKSQQLATRHRNLMDTAGQLSRQLALVFSVSQIEGYISKLANVRGEFELQQRSLEAILQNKAQADQIFNKTVQLAVKSPFQIKELVTFTKQLAAYRIESDKLYDTTKRLADVSAGLGVDMGRLILAYGQVKAAAYLRGTEVRQFTEAGINMYGELQKLFKTRDQADYTTAQIVDMISKRKVTFEDVEQVFENLTSKEGIFYNMQEIQAETLQGKISNLKDSIDVMLNSIGKANEDTLKGSIDAVKVLIDNWETVVNVAKALAPIFASMAITSWAKRVTGASSAMGIFARSIVNTGNAVKAFGATFAVSWPFMAITAAIGVVTELISTVREYNKAIAESTNKYFEAKIRISAIQDESKSDIKKALDKLVQEMNNEGFEIKIKTGISEEEAKDEFDRYFKDYEDFLNKQRIIEAKYAKNKSTILADDIEEDSKNYASSYGEFIIQGEELKTVMMQLAIEENNLATEHKKTLEQLAKGPKEGEDVLSYTKRMKDEIAKMWPALNQAFNSMRTGNGAYTKEAMEARASLTKLFKLSKEYIGDEKKMVTELESVYGSVDKYKAKAEKEKLRIIIDKSELDAVTKELAYRHYKLNIEIDKEEVKKEALTLKDQLQAEFDRNKITLSVDVLTSGKGVIDYWEKGQEQMQKTANALKKQLEYVKSHPDQYYLGGELQKMGFDLSGIKTKRGKQADENTYIDSKRVEAEIQKRLEALAKSGVTPKAGGSKAERDIWAERISVLKEMQSRYEKLNQLMGENRAIEETRSAFKGALDFTQMGEVIKAEDIIPTKQGMIDALEKLLKQIPNDVKNAAKRTGLEKEIAELKIGIQQDYLKEQLEKTKKNIESMFNGLDLHKKLKDAGLSEAEVQQLFPGLAKTLDEVQKGIEIEFQTKYADTYKDPNTQQYKDYQDAIKKIEQQRIKDSQDLVIELTKNYKSQLTDRLQLDRWYYEERAKIQRAKLTDEQKTLYESNLTSQYNKKSDENTWKQFQNSDMYISMFENIEGASTRMLTAMRDKLMSLRENLKDLPADQLKAIINQQEKIDEMIAKKNPFIGLTSGVKEYIQFLKERKELEEENIRANNAVDYYTSQSNEQSKIVEQKRQEYNAAVATSGILSKEARQLSVQLDTEKSKLDIILKQLTAEKKISKETAEQIRNGQNLGDTLKNKIGESGRIFSEFSSALPQIASDLENVFGTMSDGTKDTINRTAEAAGGIAQIATGIAQGPVGYLQAAMGLAKTVSALFGSDDARLQRQIEEHEKKIKKLEREYDKLKEGIDNVWDITKLQEYGNDLDENINKQIVSLNAMIAAERDKKDTDWDKINEWQEQIEDLRDTLADSANDMIAELGGVGSDENFKTLAENFASAWLEAFQETGDGLSGLQESFDDFMENYVKQQILLRLSDKFFGKMFEEFDNLIATRTDMEQEDQERYFELQAQITKLRNTANNSVVKSVAKKANAAADEIENSEEYKKLQEAWTDFLKPNDINTEAIKDWSDKMKEVFGEYNEAAEEIFNQIGWEPGGKANLSALQQGIQGITETTAEALEALLNSIRWFVSQQTTDITAIRNLLDARYSLESQAETNPMLIELKAQTGYLEIISDRIDRVFAPNSNSRGAGLRVFISD